MTRPTLAGFKKKALKNAEVRAEYEAREHITRPGPPSLSEECGLPSLAGRGKGGGVRCAEPPYGTTFLTPQTPQELTRIFEALRE